MLLLLLLATPTVSRHYVDDDLDVVGVKCNKDSLSMTNGIWVRREEFTEKTFTCCGWDESAFSVQDPALCGAELANKYQHFYRGGENYKGEGESNLPGIYNQAGGNCCTCDIKDDTDI